MPDSVLFARGKIPIPAEPAHIVEYSLGQDLLKGELVNGFYSDYYNNENDGNST